MYDSSHLAVNVFSYSRESTTECLAHSPRSLDPPFEMSYSKLNRNDYVIDTFLPISGPINLSPTSSSASSDLQSAPASQPFGEAFSLTRSRVVLLFNLPDRADVVLSAIFCSPNSPYPTPISLWTRQRDSDSNVVWAVYKTHTEACTTISLSGPAMSVAPALESDLEPFHDLQRFKLASNITLSQCQERPQMNSIPSLPISSRIAPTAHFNISDYTLSSNPPNARTSFRVGDWICRTPNCAAHNFGRNLACIGCGSPRSTPSPAYQQLVSPAPTRTLPSPRFAPSPNTQVTFSPISSQASLPSSPIYSTHQEQQHPSLPVSKNAHPLLTPSGRAFSVGGRVQNISSDPLTPCIMYWPDNEPIPEPGQIRPSTILGVQQPPILNTGNRGPISHQPGDWICQKCNYLNWRRRKVCQTCFPYAEGNGDSISAAVQAERIALLTSVLTQTQMSAPLPRPPNMRSQSMTPPEAHRAFVDVSPPISHIGAVHRSQSHIELGAQYSNTHPIYQTSGRAPSPVYSTAALTSSLQTLQLHNDLHAPAPLLPSFLHDIVQSPTLSPSSTSSADLSFEEYEDSILPPPSAPYRRAPAHHHSSSSSSSPLSSIWRLDGEETKSLATFPFPPSRQSSRNNSLERIKGGA